MANLPVKPLPTFHDTTDAGSALLAKLNDLGYAVQFWTDNDIRPTWHLYKTATASIPANTWTSINYGTVAFDSDGVSSGGGATIVTPGIYAVEMCAQAITGTTGIGFWVSFLATAGANNPAVEEGFTENFAIRGGQTVISDADSALCSSDLTPWVMYPGDTLQGQVYATASCTLDNNNNSTFEAGRFVCNFTGLLVQTP